MSRHSRDDKRRKQRRHRRQCREDSGPQVEGRCRTAKCQDVVHGIGPDRAAAESNKWRSGLRKQIMPASPSN